MNKRLAEQGNPGMRDSKEPDPSAATRPDSTVSVTTVWRDLFIVIRSHLPYLQ